MSFSKEWGEPGAIALVISCAIIIPLICGLGCASEKLDDVLQKETNSSEEGLVGTIKEGNHTYVIYGEYNSKGGILHDPDCKCGKGGK